MRIKRLIALIAVAEGFAAAMMPAATSAEMGVYEHKGEVAGWPGRERSTVNTSSLDLDLGA